MNFMNRNNLHDQLTGLTNSRSNLWVLHGKAYTIKLLYVEYANNIIFDIVDHLKLIYVINLINWCCKYLKLVAVDASSNCFWQSLHNASIKVHDTKDSLIYCQFESIFTRAFESQFLFQIIQHCNTIISEF